MERSTTFWVWTWPDQGHQGKVNDLLGMDLARPRTPRKDQRPSGYGPGQTKDTKERSTTFWVWTWPDQGHQGKVNDLLGMDLARPRTPRKGQRPSGYGPGQTKDTKKRSTTFWVWTWPDQEKQGKINDLDLLGMDVTQLDEARKDQRPSGYGPDQTRDS